MPSVRVQLVVGLTIAHRVQASGRTGQLGWRLLGGNNREYARSTLGYDDENEARRAIAALQSDVARGVVTISADAAARLWTWHIDVDDKTAICCPRGHVRRTDAELGVRRCLATLPGAMVSPVVLGMRRPGGLPTGGSGPTDGIRPRT